MFMEKNKCVFVFLEFNIYVYLFIYALLLIYFVHTLIYKYTELPVILICFFRFLNYLCFVANIYIYILVF